MLDKERSEARVVKRILDARTREVVGWLYRWEEGGEFVLWKDGPVEDVVHE